MRVLAIDPGYERIGIAVVEKKERQKEVLVFSECFQTSASLDFVTRLGLIGARIRDVLAEYSVDMLAIEGLFFSKNTKTALKVSEARGVILFQAVDRGVSVFEYTPNQIKVAVTGYGKATKNDIHHMIHRLIKLDDRKRIDDEIDAIAIGLTLFASYRK